MLKVSWNRCPYCHRGDIHTSNPKHLGEELAVLLLLQPVRCHDCMRRFFRSLFAAPSPTLARSIQLKKPIQGAVVVEKDKGRAA